MYFKCSFSFSKPYNSLVDVGCAVNGENFRLSNLGNYTGYLKQFFFDIISIQSYGFQQLDQFSNATLTRKLSENSCKALALSAFCLSPWFLYIYSREPTELQELEKETSLAVVVQLSVMISII